MARRNMLKTVEGVRVPDAYCLTISELEKLMLMANEGGKNGLYDSLVTAFQYGFVLGGRFAKKPSVLQEYLGIEDDGMELLRADAERKGCQVHEVMQYALHEYIRALEKKNAM